MLNLYYRKNYAGATKVVLKTSIVLSSSTPIADNVS